MKGTKHIHIGKRNTVACQLGIITMEVHLADEVREGIPEGRALRLALSFSLVTEDI